MAPSLNWASATVKGASLSVEIDGDPPRGWKQGFATTVKLLGGGEWGEVSVKKQMIRVKDIAVGQEEKLRHFLDGVVEQANASHPSEDEDEHEDERDDDGGDGDRDDDAKMTDRFRAFADGGDGGGDGGDDGDAKTPDRD